MTMHRAALAVATVLILHVFTPFKHAEARFASPYIWPRGQNVTYVLAQNFSGENFFTGWNFLTGPDVLNWGNVLYVNQSDAMTQGLTYINSHGNAIIKVDNTTYSTSPTYGRNSVYMMSQGTINVGSLVLFQAKHMPYGCGVWPGFWTLGGNSSDWPLYGEIDIVENVNLAIDNQYSLHTEAGCTHPPATSGVETGWVGHLDCWNRTLFNTGCIVVETKPNNYGAGFAGNGGGAYALQWTSDAMRLWFFPRGAIPADFDSASPTPGNWGLPSALYPQSYCNFSNYFSSQAIVLDINLCGLYAGEPAIYNAGGLCRGLCTDLIHYPANFDQAYFEIEFLRVFVEVNGKVSPIPSVSTTATSSPTVISGHVPGAAIPVTNLSMTLFVGLCLGAIIGVFLAI